MDWSLILGMVAGLFLLPALWNENKRYAERERKERERNFYGWAAKGFSELIVLGMVLVVIALGIVK